MGVRRINLDLSPAVIMAASIAFIVVLAWVFVFGIIVGRGYTPPAPEAQPEAVVIQPPQVKEEEKVPEPTIIPAEELNFMAELKSPNGAKPAAKLPQDIPAVQAETKNTAKKAAPPVAPRPEVKPLPPNAQNFVYQAAVCATRDAASKACARLTSSGVKAVVVPVKRGKKQAFLVQASVQGTTRDASALKQKLIRAGFRDAFQVSKKPVAR